jgi:hypothetical protein
MAIFFAATLLGVPEAFAQTATMQTSGNWDAAGNWNGNNIGDAITENVVIAGDNMSPKVRSNTGVNNYTIGNLIANGNQAQITIDGTLTLGASGNPKSMAMGGLNPVLTVNGTLTIWGDLTFTNKITWNVNGTVIVHGNVTMNGGSDLDVPNGGSLEVFGNFIGGNNSDVKLTGHGLVKVHKNVSVSSGNLHTAAETFSYGGTCTPAGGAFCNSATHDGTLPIKLVNFDGVVLADGIKLDWSTASEKNFDYFEVERAGEELDFKPLTRIGGKGGPQEVAAYSFLDGSPLPEKNYYRLKRVDLDGTFEYSSLLLMSWQEKTLLGLYPNPVTDQSITIQSPVEDGTVTFVLLSSLGRIVYQTDVPSGKTQLIFPETIAPGVYVVKLLLTNGDQKTVRIKVD